MHDSGPLRGVVAATITPLDATLEPDLPRLVTHCRRLLALGCDGINLLGTTGEAASFSVDRRLAIMRAVARAGLPLDRIMVGTGASALDDATVLTREALTLGYCGALVIPPFYFKGLDDDDVFAYYSLLIENVGRARARIFLYHFPAMSGVGFDLPLVDRLVSTFGEAILGIKDSSGDVAFARRIARAFPTLAVFPSSETELTRARDDGFAGCVSASVNVTAPIAARVWRATRAEPATVNPDDVDALAAIRRALTSVPLVAAIKHTVARLVSDPALARPHPPLGLLGPARAASLDETLGALPSFAELGRAYSA